MPDQILDLSELAPQRQQVRFEADGPLHELATPNDLTLAQRAQLFQLHSQMDRLNSKPKLTQDQAKQLSQCMKKATMLVMPDVPEEDIDQLSDLKREAVVLSFMSAFGDTISRLAKAAGGETMEAALQQISES